VGDLVLVPFASRSVQGVVRRLDALSPEVGAKDVESVVEKAVLWPWQFQLADWIAEYYCCALADAVTLMLPPVFRNRPSTALRTTGVTYDPDDINEREAALLELLQAHDRPLLLSKARTALGRAGLEAAVRNLSRRGLVERVDKRAPRPSQRRGEALLRPVGDLTLDDLPSGMGERQRAVMEFLLGASGSGKNPKEGNDPGWTTISEVMAETGASSSTIRTLQGKGFLEISRGDPDAEADSAGAMDAEAPLDLTPAQDQVWNELSKALDASGSKTMLLHGVTGSGKTEIYLRALAQTLRQGRQAIILVPEIALTPQTVHRFAARFPSRVAVLHSGLSRGAWFAEWSRIHNGRVDVVIGSRSAIFAPLRDPGLIVIDEEHEWTYKQDHAPRYHTRDVASKLAELVGAKVVLGSATPDVVSYYQADRQRNQLLSLPERVARATSGSDESDERGLPPVELVDMRQELMDGHRGILSRLLQSRVAEALDAHQQSILFINRRGTAPLVLCRDCGQALKCKRCDVALVYHSQSNGASEHQHQNQPEGTLVCHQCNKRYRMPKTCPSCGSTRIRQFGVGTERIQEEAQRLFPKARVLRWDRDVVKSLSDHERILSALANHEADILVGTQMIAKGLDLPLVTVVGVIDADTALNLPDFRAGERTFQLLTQVAGRAGRGEYGGRVVVQTYAPDHYCIQAASRHDYEAFYRQEIEFRRQHGYPPWQQLAKLVYAHAGEDYCCAAAEKMAALLRSERDRLGLESIEVIGPVPAFYHKLRGKNRWQVLLQGQAVQKLVDQITLPLGWVVDIDPVTLL
jgi:primosomal protein N' (replication factor Y)